MQLRRMVRLLVVSLLDSVMKKSMYVFMLLHFFPSRFGELSNISYLNQNVSMVSGNIKFFMPKLYRSAPPVLCMWTFRVIRRWIWCTGIKLIVMFFLGIHLFNLLNPMDVQIR